MSTEPGSEPDSSNPAARDADDRAAVSVVLLTNFIPPYRLPLYEALADRVAHLTVLVSTPVEENRSWRPETGRLDVRVQRTVSLRREWRHPSAGFAYPIYVHIPWDTFAQLRRLRPDVVVSSGLGFRSLFSALYCLGARQSRLVLWATLSERTEQGRGTLRQLLRKWLLRRADRVIVNGASGERYVRRFGVPEDRIDRVPYTALPSFAVAGADPRRPGAVRHLLFAGMVVELKGLVPFVHALNEWAGIHPEEEVMLTIAGSGPVLPAIQNIRLRGKLGLRLVGEQDPAALPALFAEADAFVFPTLADEWGVVVNEALAAGLPVLGSVHSQAIEELCEEGKTGWLFDPQDRASMRSAIEAALSVDAPGLQAMRTNARNRVRTLTPEWAARRITATIQSASRSARAG